MKKIRIIAGASAAVLAIGLLTACSGKQEPVEEEPVVQEETVEQAAPEAQPEILPEEPPVEEFPLDKVEEDQNAEEQPEEELPEEELPEEEQDAEQPAAAELQVVEVMEIGEDGALTVMPYLPVEEDLTVEDPAQVDFSAFAAGEAEEVLTFGEETVYRTAEDGTLSDADVSALEVGAMLIITTDEAGVRTVVIHAPVSAEA